MRRLLLLGCFVVVLAMAAIVMSANPTQWAVRGEHGPSGNLGFGGTELGGLVGSAIKGEGVYGKSTDSLGFGIKGENIQGVGVGASGFSGVYAFSPSVGGTAMYADAIATTDTTVAVYGVADSPAYAGLFDGRVHVNGTFSKLAGQFKIDHPLDPANKYLSHSFVESPDMKNIYDGVVTLDGRGEATVTLPDWFEALNRDFRYQLTAIGEHAPVYIAEKIHGNTFRIAGGYEGQEISWQVTGTRRDLYAEAYRIPVEEWKSVTERGRFLRPELYLQSGAFAVRAQRRPKTRVERMMQ